MLSSELRERAVKALTALDDARAALRAAERELAVVCCMYSEAARLWGVSERTLRYELAPLLPGERAPGTLSAAVPATGPLRSSLEARR
jgi:hypothetical protein